MTDYRTQKEKIRHENVTRGTISERREHQVEQAEQLIEAINHGSSLCRGLYLAFLGLTAFLLIIISTTNDYSLLVQPPIKLPLFGAEVDLVGFYRFAPWVYFLAHVNLLMTIALLTRKLSAFHSKLSIQSFETREILRAKLHIFAPIQYLSKQQEGVVRFILWIICKGLLILMPPVILLLIQIDSLAMQDSTTVWLQRGALVADVVFALFLWKTLLQGRARPLAEVRMPGGQPKITGKQRGNIISTSAIYLFVLSLSFLGATIPYSPLERLTAFEIDLESKYWVRKLGGCDPNEIEAIDNYYKYCSNPIKRLFFD